MKISQIPFFSSFIVRLSICPSPVRMIVIFPSFTSTIEHCPQILKCSHEVWTYSLFTVYHCELLVLYNHTAGPILCFIDYLFRRRMLICCPFRLLWWSLSALAPRSGSWASTRTETVLTSGYSICRYVHMLKEFLWGCWRESYGKGKNKGGNGEREDNMKVSHIFTQMS